GRSGARPADRARARGPAPHRPRLPLQGDRVAARDLDQDGRGARVSGAAQAPALLAARAVALGRAAPPGRLMWTCPDCGRAFAGGGQGHTCAPLGTLEDHLAGKPPEIAEIVARFIALAQECGPVDVLPEKTRIALAARMSFAALMPRRRWVDGHVVLARRLEDPRFTRIETFSPGNHLHAFRLETPRDVDERFRAWMREAYERQTAQ